MRFLQTDAGRQFSRRPKQKNDCTVRSLAAVCHVSYDRAYEAMRAGGRRSNEGATFPPGGAWLEDVITAFDHTFHYQPSGQSSLTLHKFVDLNPTGRFVVDQEGHVAAVVNGVLFDDTPWRLREKLFGWWTVTRIRG